jgi:hypothetical protein
VAFAATLVLGFLLGLAVGRWWALAAAVAVLIWIWSSTGVDEVPHWLLGCLYGGIAAIGIAGGVAVRQRRPHWR